MNAPEKLWMDVCALEDIPWRGGRVLKIGAGCVALFRTHENEVFALDDKCPHKGGPLSQGIVHDNAVTCPLHNLVLDLATGKARGQGEGQVRTHACKRKDDRVLIDISCMTGADDLS